MRTPSPPLLKAVFPFVLAGMAACGPEYLGAAGDGPEDTDAMSSAVVAVCTGPQVALTASMLTVSDNDADKALAVDGNLSTRWAGVGTAGSDTLSSWGWLEINLGSGKKVCRVEANWYTNGDGRQYNYELHARAAGASYAKLAGGLSSSFNPKVWDGDNFLFDPASVQYLRLYADSTTNDFHSLNEIRVYVADSGGGGSPPDDTLPPPLRTVTVDTLTELRSSVSNAQAGDLIKVINGSYDVSSAITVSRDGTSANPIVISAETVGGVTFTGSAGFNLDGASHVVIRGFKFAYTAGSPGMKIDNSSYVRLTRNRFELRGTSESHWLMIDGTSHHNRIDRNTFANKSTQGNMLTFNGTGTEVVKNNVIERNYFYNHTYGGTNGGECMRVGYSGWKFSNGYNTIQNNLFERCNGDPEVISNKSSNNYFKYNTFRNNDGSLVFRHGHGSTAVGNFFITNIGGIGVYGDDHRIINNYFESNTGTGVRASICIGSGDRQDETTDSAGYDASERVLVAFNTLVSNSTHIDVGTGSHSYQPSGSTIANNILVGDSGTFVRNVVSPSSFSYGTNILWGGASTGIIPSSGYTRVDPRLVRNGILRLASGSPAIGAAGGTYSDITEDVDGQSRSGTRDIGADAYSTAPVLRSPLTTADVGPGAP